MRSFLYSSALVSLFVVGCAKESAPGGPGAKSPATGTTQSKPPATGTTQSKSPATTTTERSYRETGEDQTFTLKVPSGTTNIDQGERKDVTISIDRADKFMQTVTLQFKAPAGVKVEPSEVQLKSDQEEAKVMIDVEAAAPLGEATIDVTATPETGKATSLSMRLKVEEKEIK